MTVDTLHDALTLLPEDLVAEVGLARSRPRVIPWRRYAAMAACAAVVICMGMFVMDAFLPKYASESVAEFSLRSSEGGTAADQALPEETAAAAEGSLAQPAPPAAPQPNTNQAADTMDSPWLNRATVCYFPQSAGASAGAGAESSVTRLVQTREELDALIRDYSSDCDLTDFIELCQTYDRDWFTQNSLVFVQLAESGWYPESLTLQDEVWTLRLIRDPACESQGQQWILLDVTAGAITPEDPITVTFAP